MSYINIMESIRENLPKMRCSSCKVSGEIVECEKFGPGACFTTCQKCRENKKRSRAKEANVNSNPGSNPESSVSLSSPSVYDLIINDI